MQEYLNNLLPRLLAHNKRLELIEVLVDKEWTFIDPDSNTHEYTFLRDNRLVMSYNGIVTMGDWNLLPTGKLLINRINDSILLSNAFVDRAVLVLKISGAPNMPFILYDNQKIRDGNVQRYLEQLADKRSPGPHGGNRTTDGKFIKTYNYQDYRFKIQQKNSFIIRPGDKILKVVPENDWILQQGRLQIPSRGLEIEFNIEGDILRVKELEPFDILSRGFWATIIILVIVLICLIFFYK